ncbi:hypothetical protein ACFFHH_20215 [Cytobacillus solani]|uniref:hypothetical protein n=1 Tax=Cytobacillus solani TaxID=1637975 RepID=UPI001151640F|nr:hypothetical protein [Cytobacillus solani]
MTVHMPKKEYYALKTEKKYEITNELIFEVARYKLYYMLNNAHNRPKRREEYKNVKYKLGEFRDGMTNLLKYRPELYEKYLSLIKTYLEHELNGDFAPTIHRLQQHYEWDAIDILTSKEHKELDNSKETIVSIENIFIKSTSKSKKRKNLKLALPLKKQFPSVVKAAEYLQNEYNLTNNMIQKMIDTGEKINTKNSRIEIYKTENQIKVLQMKINRMDQSDEKLLEKFPQILKIVEQLKEISRWEGSNFFSLFLKSIPTRTIYKID